MKRKVADWLSTLWAEILRAFLIFLPALVANSSPLVFKNIFRSRKLTPIDKGTFLADGERLLGENKSIEGFFAGVGGGTIIGGIYALLFNQSEWVIEGILMGLGTMLGDLFNSFVKRRLKIKPGEPFIPMDQLTFLYGAYLTVYPFNNFFWTNLITPVDLAMGTFVVLVLHPLTNLIAYLMGLKGEPW